MMYPVFCFLCLGAAHSVAKYTVICQKGVKPRSRAPWPSHGGGLEGAGGVRGRRGSAPNVYWWL